MIDCICVVMVLEIFCLSPAYAGCHSFGNALLTEVALMIILLCSEHRGDGDVLEKAAGA